MKKKLLIVSYAYPPSNAPGAQRPYSLAKYLAKDILDITVLTCSNQDSSLGIDESFDPELPNVKLLKVRSFSTGNARKFKQSTMQGNTGVGNINIKKKLFDFAVKFLFPDRTIFWYIKLIPYILKNRKTLKADYIFSTSPFFTNHIVARFIKRFSKNSNLIVDLRDFHYVENFEQQRGFLGFLHKKLESKTIRNADKVIFISESMKNRYALSYPNESSKFYAVYNGFDVNEHSNTLKPDNSKIKIFYAGSFYAGLRTPMPLLLVLEKLINDGKLNPEKVSIEIAGNIEQSIVDEIKFFNIYKSINFLGLVPRSEVLRKYSESHLLWLIVGNKPSHYLGVPIKMFEYMAAKRYILNFSTKDAESWKIISRSGIGFNFENINESQNNIIEFERILSLFYEGKLTRIEKEEINEFQKEKQIKLLENILFKP